MNVEGSVSGVSRSSVGPWRLFLPLVVLLLAFAGAGLMWHLKKKPQLVPLVHLPAQVSCVEAVLEDQRLELESQGVMEAREQTLLTSEIGGLVLWVSPSLFTGASFAAGEVLLRIDDTSYRAALARAVQERAAAALRLEQERALALQAQRDWELSGNAGKPAPLVLREPQLEAAKAAHAAALAQVEVAGRQLSLTELKAPYAGRVRERLVSTGQVLAAGASAVASIYSIEAFEVRLTLRLGDLDLLNPGEERSIVTLHDALAGPGAFWQARLERVESHLDSGTRMARLVAVLEDPLRLSPPPAIGQFVKARLQGRVLKGACVLEREALREDSCVWVLDSENRLRIRPVEVAQVGRDSVVIQSGLRAGERIVISHLDAVIEGMKLRLFEPAPGLEPDSGAAAHPLP
jgi:RND family efflux transporter MFP subunit